MVALLIGGCTGSGEDTNRSGFPPADRPVSDIISSQFSDEETRDRLNEAETVMDMADIEEGMTAAHAIGDDTLMKEAGRRPVESMFTHGTSEQRMRWLQRGLQTGDPQQCDTFAARTL